MRFHCVFAGRCALHIVLLIGGLQVSLPVYGQQIVGVPGNTLGAQSPLSAGASQRPFRGLFGPRKTSRPVTQQLDLTASLFGLRNQLINGPGTTGNSPFQNSWNAAGGNTLLRYSAVLPGVSVSAYGATAAHYYVGYRSPLQMSYSGGVGATTYVGKAKRTTVAGSQTVAYVPFFGYYPYTGLLPNQPAEIPVSVPNNHYAAGPGTSLALHTNLRISHTLGRRTSASAYYSMDRTTYSNNPDFLWQTLGVSYHHGLTRNSSLRLGYWYRDGLGESSGGGGVWAPGALDNHTIDVGIDYARSLSPWRRTTIAFGTGSTLARRLNDFEGVVAGSQAPMSLYVTGFVAVNREVGRTWNVRGTYNRFMSYVPGFNAPFFNDAVSVGTGGAVGRRVTMSAQLSGSRGSVGLAPRGTSAQTYGNQFWAYTATAQAQYALSRHWAAFASYAYYNYLFGPVVTLPVGLPGRSGRQSIYGGLTLWLPIFSR